MQREEVHFQAVLLGGQRKISFRRSFHYFLRPFLRRVAGAGSREARPGRVREARAPLSGSARGGAR